VIGEPNAYFSIGTCVRGSYICLKYGRRIVNRAISIPKTAALKTRAERKVAVVADVAVCWFTPDLRKVQRYVAKT